MFKRRITKIPLFVIIGFFVIGLGRFAYQQVDVWYSIHREVGVFEPYLYPENATDALEQQIDDLVYLVKWRKAMNRSLWIRWGDETNNARIQEVYAKIAGSSQLKDFNRQALAVFANAYGNCCKTHPYGHTDFEPIFAAIKGLGAGSSSPVFNDEGRYRILTLTLSDFLAGKMHRPEKQYGSWITTFVIYAAGGDGMLIIHMPFTLDFMTVEKLFGAVTPTFKTLVDNHPDSLSHQVHIFNIGWYLFQAKGMIPGGLETVMPRTPEQMNSYEMPPPRCSDPLVGSFFYVRNQMFLALKSIRGHRDTFESLEGRKLRSFRHDEETFKWSQQCFTNEKQLF